MSISYNYDLKWIGRDALTSGDPDKQILAADFEAEWIKIQNAFALATPKASPTFTGTVSATDITASGTVAATGNVTGANLNVANWDTAFGWGDHSQAGYLTSTGSVALNDLTDVSTAGATTGQVLQFNGSTFDFTDVSSGEGGGLNNLVEDTTPQLGGQLDANGNSIDMGNNTITDSRVGQWITAFSWGNHASEGYLTSFTESDPTVPSHVKSITTTEKSNWSQAHGWGNHALAGYVNSTGSGASGTWPISISGNATTAGSAGSATSATTATNCTRSVVAGTNLSGGGALSTDVTVSLDSTLTSLTDVQTTNLSIGNWDIQLDGADLRFVYNGTDVFRITTAGQLIAKNDVTAFGAP